MTDHDRREHALAYAQELCFRFSEMFDVPKAASVADVLGDILADHRATRPNAAAELARAWADETMDGWRAIENHHHTDCACDPCAHQRAGTTTHQAGRPVSPHAQDANDGAAAGRSTQGGGKPSSPPSTATAEATHRLPAAPAHHLFVCTVDESGGLA